MDLSTTLRARWARLRPALAQLLHRPEHWLSAHGLVWLLAALALAGVFFSPWPSAAALRIALE